MTELERHPQAARQGAAAVAVVVFTAAGMPAMAMRAEAQRTDADWSARALAFNEYLREGADTAGPSTLAFDVAAADYGWRARASAMIAEDAFDKQAVLISARVRDNSALAPVKPFQPASLRVAAKNSAEQRCMAEAIYYEARSESRQGQMAVAEVVANRMRSPHYPNTVCGVVYQGSERATGCQFSFTCDGSMKARPRGAAWREANAIAAQVLMGMVRPVTNRATHYHTVAIDPYWSASLVETTRIGSHVFYRAPTKRERAIFAAADAAEVAPLGVEVVSEPAAEPSAVDPAAPVTDLGA
ncbi:MAG: cell wall hydrolase [Hyphomonadaceae bacterium]|nr:cell wall hydrolase [Hyphomonadaceae bacterium]